MNKIFFLLCGILILTYNPTLTSAVTQPTAEYVYSVWSTAAANRTADIWYARRSGENWNTPIRLEIEKGLHVTPVIAADRDATIWIVWIEQTTNASMLRYARVHSGKIIETERVLTGEREQSYAPAIVLDSNNIPWIAWSGIVDGFADIFSSRWADKTWSKASLVNSPNKSPDITPIMGSDDKVMWISWFGFDSTQRYVQFVAKWTGTDWTVDNKVLSSINIKSFIKARTTSEILLPQSAAQRMMGAVFLGSGNEIQSLTDRFTIFKVEGVE